MSIQLATKTVGQSPHLEAATHAGEAPPAYHAAVKLEEYKTLKLSSRDSAIYSTKSDSGNTDAPPTYSEITSGQEQKSIGWTTTEEQGGRGGDCPPTFLGGGA